MRKFLAIAFLASLAACSPPATEPVPTNPAPDATQTAAPTPVNRPPAMSPECLTEPSPSLSQEEAAALDHYCVDEAVEQGMWQIAINQCGAEPSVPEGNADPQVLNEAVRQYGQCMSQYVSWN